MFFRFYGTGSSRTHLKVSKFNSAHREDSIEGCNITVALVEPKLVKFYGTGSDGKIPEIVKFDSAHQEPSIEVQYVSVTQFFEFMEGLFSVSAHCGVVGLLGKKGQFLRIFPVLRNWK